MPVANQLLKLRNAICVQGSLEVLLAFEHVLMMLYPASISVILTSELSISE
tara:strand:- start:385 stop:537 length:153 start_codon:yes stop_codon:yes gene_type:complete